MRPLKQILEHLIYDPGYRNEILKHGWDYASGLEEIRLNPRRFNKLQIRNDLLKRKKEGKSLFNPFQKS